jgi:hypothetical protein
MGPRFRSRLAGRSKPCWLDPEEVTGHLTKRNGGLRRSLSSGRALRASGGIQYALRALTKRVQGANAEILEVSDIAGDDGQVVNCRGGSDHCIFNQMVCPAMHEARPGTEGPRVHAQYIVAIGNLLKPSLDLGRFVSILFTRDLNARLKLADRHGGEMQILVTHTFEPSQNRAMRAHST